MTHITFTGGRIDGTVSPPPSKSHTHRALFLASMAKGRSRIDDCLLSSDTMATVAACRAMGAEVSIDGCTATVDGGDLHAPTRTVDAMNSGTTMRIAAGILSTFDRPVTITGDASLLKRPMGPLLRALETRGVECVSDGGRPPVTVKGPGRGGPVSIDGSVSSQFITSLLLSAPLLDEDSVVTVEGEAVSAPYLDVTTRMMRLFGAGVSGSRGVFEVRGGTGYRPFDYRVPADFSSAAFPLVAGALGGECAARGMDPDDPQGDKAILDILRRAGASVEVRGDGVTVSRGKLMGCDLDMGPVPDLFPVTAVLLSTAKGDSRLYGAPQLRFKESDRIETTVRMINALGGRAEGTQDGCIIHGVDRLAGGHVEHMGDHRIMMSAAVASIVCDGPVEMDEPGCADVSYPGFPESMRSIGLSYEVRRCTSSERERDSPCSEGATGRSSAPSSKASPPGWSWTRTASEQRWRSGSPPGG